MEYAGSVKLVRLVIIAGLMIVSSACSFNATVITPEPIFVTESPSVIEPSATTIARLPISSETPAPTVVFTSTIAVAPPPVNTDTIPIRFAPNGTYLDLVDSIPAGSSKTYSVQALKGQVMSVSVNQTLDGDWAYTPMEITGEDGTFLCPTVANQECVFWRGILPATQEYLIKLMPQTNVSGFTLRVAIDPPGTTSQSFQYVSPQQTARFTYQDDFAPARFRDPSVGRTDPEFVLQFIDTSFYAKTNLFAVYLLFGSSNDSNVVTSCVQPVSFGGMEQVTDEVNINGRKFVRLDSFDAAAGNDYMRTAYRAVINSYCYEMIFYIHSGNIGNYDPSLGIKEFDLDGLKKRFEAILSTLVIK